MRRVGRILVVFALALAALPVAAACAQTYPKYTVELCREHNDPEHSDAVARAVGGDAPLFANACQSKVPNQVGFGSFGGTVAAEHGSVMEVVTPPGSRFSFVAFSERLFDVAQPASNLTYELLTESQRLQFVQDDGRQLFPVEGTREYAIGGHELLAQIVCRRISCTGAPLSVTFTNIAAELEDLGPPVFLGDPVVSSVARGTVGVGFSAADDGSGIADVGLVVDGHALPSVHVENDGKCKEPFLSVAPCAQELRDAILPLDTSAYSDGSHRVAVVAIDATGQSTESKTSEFEIHNAPVNAVRPIVRGTAFVGGTLLAEPGRWVGAPTEFSYQWLRCPVSIPAEGDGGSCTPISGATGTRYQPTADDLGHRVLYQVTALNSAGPGLITSVAGEVVASAPPQGGGGGGSKGPIHPLISALKLSRKRFRVGATLGKGRGSVLSFSSTQNGNLTMLIERPKKHRKWARVSKLAAAIKQGRSQVLLSGEFGKGKKLRPGNYRVTLTVRNAVGLASDPVSATFTIKRG